MSQALRSRTCAEGAQMLAVEKSEVQKVQVDATNPMLPLGVKRSFDEAEGRLDFNSTKAPVSTPTTSPQCPNVRLAMSLDGAVRIKKSDEDTPSPPKERPMQSSSALGQDCVLRRSQSATGPNVSSLKYRGKRTTPNPKTIGSKFGRSRDVRTWEFYCDSDSRDALSNHAESESSGSAVSALNLIRSQSQKAKTHAETLKASHGTSQGSPMINNLKTPKISRAVSSMARLQQSDQGYTTLVKKGGPPTDVRLLPGDSDKENWAPGTQNSDHPLRRVQPSGSQRPVLGDHARASGRGRALNEVFGVDRKGVRGNHKGNPDNKHTGFSNEGVKALMKEGEKGQELDCVQGLLSLSQGAWK